MLRWKMRFINSFQKTKMLLQTNSKMHTRNHGELKNTYTQILVIYPRYIKEWWLRDNKEPIWPQKFNGKKSSKSDLLKFILLEEYDGRRR